MNLLLNGRTALVAGSTSGLGLGVARTLAGEGARVMITGRRADAAQAAARDLPDAQGIQVDLNQPGAPEQLVSSTESALGPIDILILNTGGPPPGAASDVSAEDLGAAVHQLFLQQVALARAVLPGMRARGWGRIVAVGSSGVQQPLENLTLSNVGRSALAAYLKTLSREVAADGVTVNMVLPGRIDTGRVASLDQSRAKSQGITSGEARQQSEQSIPARRYGTVEEFAAVVCFLCGSPASYVTGGQIRCDGGLVGSY